MSNPDDLIMVNVDGTNGRRLSIQTPNQMESTLSAQLEIVPGAKVNPASTITSQILMFNKTGPDFERAGWSNYNNEVAITSDSRGSGVARPMIFYVDHQALIDLRAKGGERRIGFFGVAPVARPLVTGSRSDGTALASLLGALSALGLVTDQTSA